MFTIYSTQCVYISKFNQIANAVPNGVSSSSIYVEDAEMKRNDTIIAKAQGRMIIDLYLTDRPLIMEMGAKLEEEYNDDATDDVTEIAVGIQYFYEPPTING